MYGDLDNLILGEATIAHLKSCVDRVVLHLPPEQRE